MNSTAEDRHRREQRNVITSLFVAVLIGLAFQEMVGPVRESLHASGITLSTFLLFLIFFLTSVRFFIGNQLHLISEALLEMKGIVWFYDLFWIILQSMILIFLGGLSTVQANSDAQIGFVGLLMALCAVDVAWIGSQWVLGKGLDGWQRRRIPWAWAILNTLLIAGIVILLLCVDDVYSVVGLVWLGLLNVAAFAADILLVNHHKLI